MVSARRAIATTEGCRPWQYPLLSRHKVQLIAPNGGGERFSEVFCDVWRRLPYQARRRMLWHWRELGFGGGKPRIELLENWSTYSEGVLGQVRFMGAEIRFHASSVRNDAGCSARRPDCT